MLIKQLVAVLSAELPNPGAFVTRSLVPGYVVWMAQHQDASSVARQTALSAGD